MKNPFFSFCLSFILLMNVTPISAQRVSMESAMQKALLFLKRSDSTISKTKKAPRKSPQLNLTNYRDEFYIFNDDSNGGFVVVSGEERMPEILGYSYEGRFVVDNLPDNIRAWLDGYAAQVDYLRKHPQTKISSYNTVQGNSITPMLDCEWNQWWPYNEMCPNGAPTGCVATAMAQIMYYHKWPEQTRAVIHGYTNDKTRFVVPDYPVTNIDWNNIQPSYNEDSTPEQTNAIAQLMAICGASAKTNYDYNESSTLVDKAIKAFPQYFGYDKNISLVNYSDYDLTTWNQLIYDELSNHRPVLYGGSNETTGHAFVVDGYDGNDYFHLNWGWGGEMNGNFLLTVLPDFNNDQYAVIGIQHSNAPLPDAYGVLENGTMTLYYDTEMDNRPGIVFPDLIITSAYHSYPFAIDVLRCPPEPGMTTCVIDPSFADYELETLYGFFYQCENLKSIKGLKNLNTSHVIDMGFMFLECSSLKEIDFSGFNTDNVVYMDGMFNQCTSLEELDLSSFNTENAEYMNDMFNGCTALKKLDLRSFNTKSLLTTWCMFYDCVSLTELDISSFNTENVVDMAYTFCNCSSLKSLDLSNFNTEKVVQIAHMFEGCTSLESVDISSFNTENVKDMGGTFWFCESLKNLDLTNFNTSNVTSLWNMFGYCTSLESVDISSFNTEKVTNMGDMFMACTSLKTLDVSNFNTSNVTWMERMFDECESLESLDLSNFNTDKITSMLDLFRYCYSLKSLNISSFNTSNVTNMWSMFEGCSSLEDLDLSNFNTENVDNMYCMFGWCCSLKTLDLSTFNTSKVKNMNRLFIMCMDLETIYVNDDWDTSGVEDGEAMFDTCIKLVGEKGTTYSDGQSGLEYAHIDGGPDNPGYLSRALPTVILQDDADNTAVILEETAPCKVVLKDRTFYKDGSWNTLCLPFDLEDGDDSDALTFTGTPLEGAVVKTLESATFADGTLTLNFINDQTSIEAGKPYIVKWGITIGSTADWENFAEKVSYGTYKNEPVYLTADIEISSTVGTEEHPFTGTFDGRGHTLICSITGQNGQGTAPFRYISDATIQNVKTTGNINGIKHCAGLVGFAWSGTNNIKNCEVAATINCGSDTHCGGILGHGKNSTTTITDCLFSGGIFDATDVIGIIYGWSDCGEHTIINCMAAGTYDSNNSSKVLMGGGCDMQTIINCFSNKADIIQANYNDATGADLVTLLGKGWEVRDGIAVPVIIPSDIIEPVFRHVTIENIVPSSIEDEAVTFIGSFSPVSLAKDDKTILYLGANNTLYYPYAAMTIGSCRAYFKLNNDLTADNPINGINNFMLNFGENTSIHNSQFTIHNTAGWYTLDGRKLSGEPTQKGIYINNGEKMVVK